MGNWLVRCWHSLTGNIGGMWFRKVTFPLTTIAQVDLSYGKKLHEHLQKARQKL